MSPWPCGLWATKEATKFQLGCLERWGVVEIEFPATGIRDRKSVGWGSGKGILMHSVVHLTKLGRAAAHAWPKVVEEIEKRWRTRLEQERMRILRDSLTRIIVGSRRALPQALPSGLEAFKNEPAISSAEPAVSETSALPLLCLVSQALTLYAIEFDRVAVAPLELCANTLRVIEAAPVPSSEIARLTGCSPETSDIGWQLKLYATLARNPSGARGTVGMLNPAGFRAVEDYRRVSSQIERDWEISFGVETVQRLRSSIEGLFVATPSGESPVLEALTPPPGVVRSGALIPALGRRTDNDAARQRRKAILAQNEAYLADPANALPHFPLWDMNRGFGP